MVDVFSGIKKADKKKLLKELESNSLCFDKNVSISKSISSNNILGIIEQGSAQIIRNDYDGNIIIIDDLSSGSIFGTKFSLLDNDEF